MFKKLRINNVEEKINKFLDKVDYNPYSYTFDTYSMGLSRLLDSLQDDCDISNILYNRIKNANDKMAYDSIKLNKINYSFSENQTVINKTPYIYTVQPTPYDQRASLFWGDEYSESIPDTPLYNNKEYNELNSLHFQCLFHIRKMYNRVYGDELNILIELCQWDIMLAPQMKEIEYQYEVNFDNFETYKYLAIIFEKQSEYKKALFICEHAIDLGYDNDYTKGRMQGRIKRLRNKITKSI